MRKIAVLLFLLPPLLPSCASSVPAVSVGADADGSFYSNAGIFDIHGEDGDGGYFVQIPGYYLAAAIIESLFNYDDFVMGHRDGNVDPSFGPSHVNDTLHSFSAGKVFPFSEAIYFYGGLGLSFVYEYGAYESGTSGYSVEYSRTYDPRPNVSVGFLIPREEGGGLQLNYDSGAKAWSVGFFYKN